MSRLIPALTLLFSLMATNTSGIPVRSPAAVLTVPGDFPSIAAALAAAVAGDTVVIACDTYNEHTLVVPSGVVVTSATGDPECVTINPGEEGVGVFIVDGGQDTVLKGITVTGARAAGGAALRGSGSPTVVLCAFIGNDILGFAAGGAVNLGGAPRFDACRFVDNHATGGGAVSCSGGVFVDCTFVNNVAGDVTGGAIYGAASLIDGCVFEGNVGYLGGGAIDACVDTLRSCLFVDNSVASSYGQGGAALLQCDGVISQCTFVGNAAIWGPWVEGLALATWGDLTIDHSIVASCQGSIEAPDAGALACLGAGSIQIACSNIYGTTGSGDWIGCVASQAGIAGNLSVDPLFCNVANNDYRLSSLSPSFTADCGFQGAYDTACDPTEITSTVVPKRAFLYQNVPNPFNPATQIRFDVTRDETYVRLEVYDVSGRRVRSLVEGEMRPGTHVVTWDGRNEQGRRVSSGVYLCRLVSGNVVNTRKMVLLK